MMSVAALAELFSGESRPVACILCPRSADEAPQAIAALESTTKSGCPTVCILPEGVSASSDFAGKTWLRAMSYPVDCFELSSEITTLAEVQQ